MGRQPLTEEQRELAAAYVPFATSMAEHAVVRHPRHRDDLFSAAMLGLTQAAQSYGPHVGVKFATFASYRIRGAMLDALRGVGVGDWKGRPVRPLPVGLDEFHEEEGRILNAGRGPAGGDVDSAESFESMLGHLHSRQSDVCRAVFARNESQDEVAARMGLSKSYVSRLKLDALAILRSRLTPANA